jgi:ABC-type Fe3+ transport system permease subunit
MSAQTKLYEKWWFWVLMVVFVLPALIWFFAFVYLANTGQLKEKPKLWQNPFTGEITDKQPTGENAIQWVEYVL